MGSNGRRFNVEVGVKDGLVDWSLSYANSSSKSSVKVWSSGYHRASVSFRLFLKFLLLNELVDVRGVGLGLVSVFDAGLMSKKDFLNELKKADSGSSWF